MSYHFYFSFLFFFCFDYLADSSYHILIYRLTHSVLGCGSDWGIISFVVVRRFDFFH